jgi:prepilin-type N-terminal cleavage/methylation domain-containing protein
MKRGFTLIEFMVVVAILLILAAIILPNVKRSQEQAKANEANKQSKRVEKPAKPAYEIDLSKAGIPADVATTPDSVGMMFCLDRSGSMSGRIDKQRKIDISKGAMRQVFAQVDSYVRAHPEKKVKVGLCSFNTQVDLLQPLDTFSPEKLQQAIQPMEPSGGTAIGAALQRSTEELLKSGDETKAILVMTDGENTSGVVPELVVEAIKNNANSQHAATAGIETYLVAFDVAASQFARAKNAGAIVVESRDQKSLEGIMSSLVEQVLLEKE